MSYRGRSLDPPVGDWFVVTYVYKHQAYDVEVVARDRDAAQRRAFWSLANYLNADLDVLKSGFAGSRKGRLKEAAR